MKRLLFLTSILTLLSMRIGTALAAPTQNWNGFLADNGIDVTNPQTAAHGMILGQTKEALGVAVSVEGLYYDGETFLLGFRTENLRPQSPALVLYTDVIINGAPARATADHPLSRWSPHIFGLSVAGDPINNLMTDFNADMDYFLWNGAVEVSSHFIVLKPSKPIVIVDAEIHNAYDHEDMEEDRQAMLSALRAEGVTIAEAGDTDADAWREKGYLVLNRYGDSHLEDWKEGDSVPALTGLDLPDAERQEIVIAFHVNLDDLSM